MGAAVTELDAALSAALHASGPARRILVAYSGGMDSHVLLHLLWRRQGPEPLLALHVNHGLSSRADAWETHCRRVCADLGVPCRSERVTVTPHPQGPEAGARAARYAVFTEQLRDGDLLVFGHHADDQAETLLYRLLRTGIASGMPATRTLGRGRLLRPLLALPRAVLADYAAHHGLDWVEDESNARLDFDRNYLRQCVLPALAGRWPDVAGRLRRAAERTREQGQLSRELAAIDLAALDERAERVGRSLGLERLAALSPERQRNALRHWRLPGTAGPEPGGRRLDSLLRDLVGAAPDAAPLVVWQGGQWRRFRRRLYLLPANWGSVPDQDHGPWEWSPEFPLALPDGASIRARRVLERGWRAHLPGGRIEVRFRRGGERVRPTGRKGSSTLKKVLQERGIEPWLRDRVPLIECDGQLVAVGDLFVCEGAMAGSGESGWLLTWQAPKR